MVVIKCYLEGGVTQKFWQKRWVRRGVWVVDGVGFHRMCGFGGLTSRDTPYDCLGRLVAIWVCCGADSQSLGLVMMIFHIQTTDAKTAETYEACNCLRAPCGLNVTDGCSWHHEGRVRSWHHADWCVLDRAKRVVRELRVREDG
jgi:hypothetical protein